MRADACKQAETSYQKQEFRKEQSDSLQGEEHREAGGCSKACRIMLARRDFQRKRVQDQRQEVDKGRPVQAGTDIQEEQKHSTAQRHANGSR
jgi:hypothetical protein